MNSLKPCSIESKSKDIGRLPEEGTGFGRGRNSRASCPVVRAKKRATCRSAGFPSGFLAPTAHLVTKLARDFGCEHDATGDLRGRQALSAGPAECARSAVGFAAANSQFVARELLLLALESEEPDAGGVGDRRRGFTHPAPLAVAHHLPQVSLSVADAGGTVVNAGETGVLAGFDRIRGGAGADRHGDGQDSKGARGAHGNVLRMHGWLCPWPLVVGQVSP